MSHIDIFHYVSYRAYLRDIYLAKKQEDKKFSLQYFASKIGFSSRGNLKMIMDGKSNISAAAVKRINAVLKHDKKQCDYFHAMVFHDQAKSDEERSVYFETMASCKPKIVLSALERSRYEVITDKLFLIIREAVEHPDFKEDPEFLAKQLSFPESPKKIRYVIDTLLRLGLLKRDAQGKLKQVDSVLTTPSSIDTLDAARYLQQILSLTYKMVTQRPEHFLDMTTMTIPIPKGLLDDVRKKVTAFREDLVHFVNASGKNYDEVYMFNVQFFPVTRFREESI